jgi:tRNA nucleotidyltransferase (CCA-adding enzyme)
MTVPQPPPLIVILTHEHTDFDALASLLAAARLYPQALPVLPRQMNRNLEEFLAVYRDALPFVHQADLPRRRIERAILVDTQSVQPVRGMHASTAIEVIDHHPRSATLPDDWAFSGEEVGAATTLFTERLAESGIALPPIEATLLMLGIYEDTGNLTYETTTPRDLRCAAALLERGASLTIVDKYLHHPLTDDQRLLYQQLADNSQPFQLHGQSIIISTATVPEPVAEISTLAHKLHDLYEPDALFMLVDMGNRIQLVARSSSDAIDVGEIALALGGGGHSRAAAALIKDNSLPGVFDALVYLLQSHVRPPITVASLMSYGRPQTLTPTDTIADAAQAMRRYGFEGFPVLDQGKVVGMLTRREIDRAMQHALGAHPVSRYMRTGEVYVSPEDSIETLRQVMHEFDWGQVPVLNRTTGELLGIVTRTDLIKQWSGGDAAAGETLADAMSRALPEELLNWLHQAGESANEMGYRLYAVGGFVRDLLLGAPNFDIDLVVEGDAIRLAEHVAERLGGYVRSHRRFGTAKWIVPDTLRAANSAGLPPALDFVTARTEFYERPTALPTVERSTIKQDLHRRDFTINTLAIRLEPRHWAELLDFYGGKKDLEEGLIRVLHNLSFVEDPTRILRAVRFEQRFGFRIETRTEELIGDARSLLDRVSGERVRHELDLIATEAEPERALCRLSDLGVLAGIDPALECDGWYRQKAPLLRATFDAARDPDNETPPFMALDTEALPRLHLALLVYRLTPDELARFIDRFRILKAERTLMLEVSDLAGHLAELAANGSKPSQVVNVLQGFGDEARLVARVATNSWQIRHRLDQYQRRWREMKPCLDGDDLKALGVPQGPIYRQLLRRLRSAVLDGEVTTRNEEEKLARDWVAADRAHPAHRRAHSTEDPIGNEGTGDS